jgi:putative acetyltransferase
MTIKVCVAGVTGSAGAELAHAIGGRATHRVGPGLIRTNVPGRVMQIRTDDLTGEEIRALLAEHLREMHSLSPPESVHALDLTALRRPDITFWSVWFADTLLGCGALKELSATHGEIKSMRTAPAHRRCGVAGAMLEHIVAQARGRGYRRLSLETGALPAFAPARRLYERFGFTYCPPFGEYREDPHSAFLSRSLDAP